MDEAAQARIDGIRAVWSAGSYEAVGDLWASIGSDLAAELDDRIGLSGRVVLDAACGTGNTTLALARHGATVTGMDLTPSLLATAADRATAAGLEVAWQEGDLLDMPFEDDAFDIVTSTFGAFTADDPHACAAELVRVCRPGGTIGLTAWTRDGIFDRGREPLFAHYPILNQNRPDTGAWAERDGLEDRFGGTGARLVDLEERDIALPFPSVEAAVDFFGQMSGPMIIARMAVEGMGGDWDALMPEVVAAWQPVAEPTEDGVVLRSTYARALLELPA